MINETKRKIIIDCDPAIGVPGYDADDPLALALAIASEEVELIGITTVFGNVSNEITTRGAIKLVQELGHTEIPVARGMELPLCGEHPGDVGRAYREERGREGNIPLPPIEGNISPLHAVDFIISKVREFPGEVSILPIGPQTNVAMALIKDPSIRKDIREIIFMGGAMGFEPKYGRGNVTPVAELNIWHDPEAAQIVFSSGIPITMVGLDVTNPVKKTVMYESVIRKMASYNTRAAKFLYAVCDCYIKAPMFHGSGREPGCIMYDPLVVASFIDRSLVTTEKMKVAVELVGSHTRGQTVALYAPDEEKTMNVCVDVDGERAIEMMSERLLSLCAK